MYLSIQIIACCLVTEPQTDPELLPKSEMETLEAEKNDKIAELRTDGQHTFLGKYYSRSECSLLIRLAQ